VTRWATLVCTSTSSMPAWRGAGTRVFVRRRRCGPIGRHQERAGAEARWLAIALVFVRDYFRQRHVNKQLSHHGWNGGLPDRGEWLLMGVGSRGLGAELGSGRPAFRALFTATLLCVVSSGGVAGATAIRVRRERWS
jgi:hypothetical protein